VVEEGEGEHRLSLLVDHGIATFANARDEAQKPGLKLRFAPHGHEIRNVRVTVVRRRHVRGLPPVLDAVAVRVEEGVVAFGIVALHAGVVAIGQGGELVARDARLLWHRRAPQRVGPHLFILVDVAGANGELLDLLDPPAVHGKAQHENQSLAMLAQRANESGLSGGDVGEVVAVGSAARRRTPQRRTQRQLDSVLDEANVRRRRESGGIMRQQRLDIAIDHAIEAGAIATCSGGRRHQRPCQRHQHCPSECAHTLLPLFKRPCHGPRFASTSGPGFGARVCQSVTCW
jgi:hypothetical protein